HQGREDGFTPSLDGRVGRGCRHCHSTPQGYHLLLIHHLPSSQMLRSKDASVMLRAFWGLR
ncbi:MAG TPA: hypothetical protein VJM51_07885, partial [Dehalococcoidia bacterium]|nr:hypothetical protein [Dehalococcoidia bacterium]